MLDALERAFSNGSKTPLDEQAEKITKIDSTKKDALALAFEVEEPIEEKQQPKDALAEAFQEESIEEQPFDLTEGLDTQQAIRPSIDDIDDSGRYEAEVESYTPTEEPHTYINNATNETTPEIDVRNNFQTDNHLESVSSEAKFGYFQLDQKITNEITKLSVDRLTPKENIQMTAQLVKGVGWDILSAYKDESYKEFMNISDDELIAQHGVDPWALKYINDGFEGEDKAVAKAMMMASSQGDAWKVDYVMDRSKMSDLDKMAHDIAIGIPIEEVFSSDPFIKLQRDYPDEYTSIQSAQNQIEKAEEEGAQRYVVDALFEKLEKKLIESDKSELPDTVKTKEQLGKYVGGLGEQVLKNNDELKQLGEKFEDLTEKLESVENTEENYDKRFQLFLDMSKLNDEIIDKASNSSNFYHNEYQKAYRAFSEDDEVDTYYGEAGIWETIKYKTEVWLKEKFPGMVGSQLAMIPGGRIAKGEKVLSQGWIRDTDNRLGKELGQVIKSAEITEAEKNKFIKESPYYKMGIGMIERGKEAGAEIEMPKGFKEWEWGDGIPKLHQFAGIMADTVPTVMMSMGTTVATTLITKNPVVGFGVGYATAKAMESSFAFIDAIEYGLTPVEATRIANIIGSLNAIPEMATSFNVLKSLKLGKHFQRPFAQKLIAKRAYKEIPKEMFKQAFTEAFTETLQEFNSILIEGGYKKDEDLPDRKEVLTRLSTSFIGGFGAGGGIGAGTGAVARKKAKITLDKLRFAEKTKLDAMEILAPTAKGVRAFETKLEEQKAGLAGRINKGLEEAGLGIKTPEGEKIDEFKAVIKVANTISEKHGDDTILNIRFEDRTIKDEIGESKLPNAEEIAKQAMRESSTDFTDKEIDNLTAMVNGRNYFNNQLKKHVVDIFKTGNLGTPVEEYFEVWAKKEIVADPKFAQELAVLRSGYKGIGVSESASDIEWASTLAVQFAMGIESAEGVHGKLKQIFNTLKKYLGMMQVQADLFAKDVESGKVSERLQEVLKAGIEGKAKPLKVKPKAKLKVKPKAKLKVKAKLGDDIVTKPTKVKNAPKSKGAFYNVGLQIGTTDKRITEKDIKSALPKGVKIVKGVTVKKDEVENVFEDTHAFETSRKLTPSEMKLFREKTKQIAIPELAGNVGVIFGDATDYGNAFNAEYFVLPDKKLLSKPKKKAGEQETLFQLDKKVKAEDGSNLFDPKNPLHKDAYIDGYDQEAFDDYGESAIEDVIDDVKKLKFPLKIYRGVSTEISDIDVIPENLLGGISWSTDKSVAEGFGRFIHEKTINQQDINYESTMSRRIMHHDLYENEIVLTQPTDQPAFQLDKKQQLNIQLPETGTKILEDLNSQGIQGLVVGGAVRDAIQGKKSKDIDIEVYGINYKDLTKVLEKYGKVGLVGKEFGVIKFTDKQGNDFDFSIPRRESKKGVGHRGFDVEFDADITPEQGARRRDFTINALAYDPLTNEVYDYYGGLKDLEGGLIKMTSDQFAEDPLRVLRAMQFQSRFGMKLDPKTAKEAKKMVQSKEFKDLSKERVSEEWMKWAVKGEHPKLIFDFIRDTGLDKVYPELANLQGVLQEEEYHPEGDVESHTKEVVEQAYKIAEREDIQGDDRAVLMFSALLHDIGKPGTTATHEVKGVERITSRGHEEEGGTMSKSFLKGIGIKPDITDKVSNLISNHLAHVGIASIPKEKGKRSATRKLAKKLSPANINELLLLIEADASGRSPKAKGLPLDAKKLLDYAKEVKVTEKPQDEFLQGRDLIALGLAPGKDFGIILKKAYNAQLEGEFTNRTEAKAWLKDNLKDLTAIEGFAYQLSKPSEAYLNATDLEVELGADKVTLGKTKKFNFNNLGTFSPLIDQNRGVVQGKFRYTAVIPKHEIYNLYDDTRGFLKMSHLTPVIKGRRALDDLPFAKYLHDKFPQYKGFLRPDVDGKITIKYFGNVEATRNVELELAEEKRKQIKPIDLDYKAELGQIAHTEGAVSTLPSYQLDSSEEMTSDEYKETVDNMVEKFGLTDDIKKAGFMLADGSMIDMATSEFEYRNTEHRDAEFSAPDSWKNRLKWSPRGAILPVLLENGIIRFSINASSINFKNEGKIFIHVAKKLTRDQVSALQRRLETLESEVKTLKYDVYLGRGDANVDKKDVLESNFKDYKDVVNFIKSHYTIGKASDYENIIRQFHYSLSRRVATVEEIEETRKKYNLADIPLDKTRKWVDVFDRAEQKKEEAPYIIKAIRKEPRVLTNDEFAILALRKVEVEDLVDEAQSNLAEAVDENNLAEQSRHTVIMDGALSELDEITETLRFSNREAGRALNIIQVALKREGDQYKVTKILQLAKVAKGKKLTEEEIRKLSSLASRIKKLKAKEASLIKDIENLQEKLSKKDAVKDFKKTMRTASRDRTQSGLKTEREDLFKSLEQIGYRLNDVIGLTYESATIVSKLALNYFESGVKEIDAIVEKIQTRVPDLSKKNIYDSLGGRIKKTKKTVISNTKKEIADLKTQARLLGEIEDVYDGVFKQVTQQKNPSAKVFKLQAKLKNLKKEANKTIKEDELLEKILLKIDVIKDQLSTGIRDIKKTKRVESVSIKNVKQELSELKRLMTAKDKIADLENQIETGNFKVPVKIQTVVKSAELIETQVKLSQLRREVREYIHRMKKRTKRELFVDIITLPRTLMATADISGVLRQGIFLTARHPIIASRAFLQSTKAFFSQNTADEIDIFIRNHDNQAIREKSGLFLASLDSTSFTAREEDFVSNLGEKIPIWGRVIKASNRNMASHLNLLRVHAFDHFLKLYPNATTEELQRWASYVNISSGRGDLGAFNKVANELSVAFFSPRFSMSRVQLPFQIIKHWKHPAVRKEIIKHMTANVALLGTILFLASMAGLKVGTDPEDSDFLKIIIGDTRIDILGGLQQPTRVLILAMLKTLETAGVVKMRRDVDLFNAVARFTRYKFSPAFSIPLDLMQGKNAIGQEVDVLETFASNVAPLALRDVVEAYQSEPLLSLVVAPLVLLGVGANTFEKKTKKGKKKLRKKIR